MLVGNKLNMARKVPSWKGQTSASLATTGTVLPADCDPPPLLSLKDTHMDWWVQCWAPLYRKDMEKLKCVQLGATRMIKCGN